MPLYQPQNSPAHSHLGPSLTFFDQRKESTSELLDLALQGNQVRSLKLAPENHCQQIFSCLLDYLVLPVSTTAQLFPIMLTPFWECYLCAGLLRSVSFPIFEVSLNLGISSSIFSVYTFLYLLIYFRCLCRSPITSCLSHCSFWDFLIHTLPCRTNTCCTCSID